MSARQRILMYRFIEWIGRWSMLDIFVIAILVALVNFGNLASIDQRPIHSMKRYIRIRWRADIGWCRCTE
ncbi:paraquat-inducible protein A [Pseudomonas aeruginosa]